MIERAEVGHVRLRSAVQLRGGEPRAGVLCVRVRGAMQSAAEATRTDAQAPWGLDT